MDIIQPYENELEELESDNNHSENISSKKKTNLISDLTETKEKAKGEESIMRSINENQNYFVKENRTSSRVLQQPGGTSQVNLRWDGHEEDSQEMKRAVKMSDFANGKHQNCGNVITDRPSSRVTNPPGGKSTISLC